MSKSTPSGKSIAGVGIDIGNSKCVIAIANSHGVAEALLNEQGSKRETPTVVHFGANQRLFGALGASKAEISPSTTFSELKRFVNCHLDPTQLTGLPYTTSRDSNGNITVEVTYHNKKRKFTAVEMLGMLLSHLKKTAETAAEGRISDCVMAVPAYFSREQKTAYLNAAKIAGFKPLGLLHEGVAAAVEYGNARPEGAANSCVVFVDVGHSDTQMTVVRFDGKQRRVLGESHDSSLGGRDFDEILFKFFVEKFNGDYKIDASSDERARVRLRLACEEAKLRLSANKEADVKVDSLKDGVDVKGAITRAKFESNSCELLKRIGELFSKALANANLDKDQIDSVEMVGSGWRIPAISSTLTAIFGRNVSTTLKGAECTARGCAIFCRMLLHGELQLQNAEEETKTNLEFTKGEFTSGMIAKDDMVRLRQREQRWERKDRATESAGTERNALESYIYRTRDEFERSSMRNTDAYNEIMKALKETEDWLCKEGSDDQSAEVYKSEHHKLRTRINHIMAPRRKEERQDSARRITQADTSTPTDIQCDALPSFLFSKNDIQCDRQPLSRNSQHPSIKESAGMKNPVSSSQSALPSQNHHRPNFVMRILRDHVIRRMLPAILTTDAPHTKEGNKKDSAAKGLDFQNIQAACSNARNNDSIKFSKIPTEPQQHQYFRAFTGASSGTSERQKIIKDTDVKTKEAQVSAQFGNFFEERDKDDQSLVLVSQLVNEKED